MTGIIPLTKGQGLDGLDSSLCDLEPIHVPGAIQPHGALLAVRIDGLLITHASANLESFVGCAPLAALGRPLAAVLGEADGAALIAGMTPAGAAGESARLCRRPDPTNPGGPDRMLRLAAHRAGARLCIDIEIVETQDAVSPVEQAAQIIQSFEQAATRQELCELAVIGLRAVGGYDRVMAYRFAADGHGEVIAEALAPGMTPYLGQHYPASDIPAQARRQYLAQRVGMVVDCLYVPVKLLSDPGAPDGPPLDLTHSVLRSVSPLHRAYMRNMGTMASLTVGIAETLASEPKLWGMLVCHHRAPRVATPGLRAVAGMIGQVVSLLLASLGQAEIRLRRLEQNGTLRGLIDGLAGPEPLDVLLTGTERDMLRLVDASGALVRLDGLSLQLGSTPPIAAASQAMRQLLHEASGEILAVDDIGVRYPELWPCVRNGSGMLVAPLAAGEEDGIVWFRPERVKKIVWGGDPSAHAQVEPVSGALSPRASFAAWIETTRGHSVPWTEVEIKLARAVREAIERQVALRSRHELSALRHDLVEAAQRDAQVRQEAAWTLAQLEGKYRHLLDAAPDAIVVTRQDGEIVLANVQAESCFGFERGALLGQNIVELIPQGLPASPGGELSGDRLRAGSSRTLVGHRRSGDTFPIEVTLSPLQTDDGLLVTAAIRDITQRRAQEEQLAQLKERYRGLLEAAPDAMIMVNKSGEIVLVNLQAERQFGYSREVLTGAPVTTIIPGGLPKRVVSLADATGADTARPLPRGIELTARRRGDIEFPIEVIVGAIETPDGLLTTAAIRDISARKKAEAHLLQKVRELARSNEELDRFASIASHDLQEPLRMVASYTQLLARRYRGRLDADADEFIAFAVDGASRMQQLIQDLLAYSRIGTARTELLPTSSEDALQQALFSLRGAVDHSHAEVTHDPLPEVLADESQLIQLFQNLIGNAIKYQRDGIPCIHVSTERTGERRWMFAVKDNGLGIDPRYFEKIFGMFQRLHKREEFVGTGIGLAICKKIVERHGGAITVESEPGRGSTFRFDLMGVDKLS